MTGGGTEQQSWQTHVAAGIAALASMGFMASEIFAAKVQRRNEEEETEDPANAKDSVFGEDESWLDPVDLLWGGEELDVAATRSALQNFEAAADRVAEEIGELFLPGRTRFS